MEIIAVHDKLAVARWILSADIDDPNGKVGVLARWMNGRSHCVTFVYHGSTIGWLLFSYHNTDSIFVDVFEVTHNKAKECFDWFVEEYDIKKIRMMTTRPKAWERLLGFKSVGTIMEKGVINEGNN